MKREDGATIRVTFRDVPGDGGIKSYVRGITRRRKDRHPGARKAGRPAPGDDAAVEARVGNKKK
ncbi:MAG: hypothetical protein HYZ53_27400 [Planctomycetes bacterium]|nr:hypothetical protein [Planctomycetota bacterium]